MCHDQMAAGLKHRGNFLGTIIKDNLRTDSQSSRRIWRSLGSEGGEAQNLPAKYSRIPSSQEASSAHCILRSHHFDSRQFGNVGRCYIWYRRRLEVCHIWNHINHQPARWQDSEILRLGSAHFSLLATPTKISHNISDGDKVVCVLFPPRKECCFGVSWRTSMFLYDCQICEITEGELQPSWAIGGNDGSVIKISWASNQPRSPATELCSPPPAFQGHFPFPCFLF